MIHKKEATTTTINHRKITPSFI